MKSMKSVTVLLLCLALTAAFFVLPASATNGTEIVLYASPDGDDSGSGSIDMPFKTINGVKNYLKSMKDNIGSPVTVYLRGGIYSVDSPICFTDDDLSDVTFKAYKNEKVSVSGATPLTGFTESTVNNVRCFTKKLDTSVDNWYFRSLFSADTEKNICITRYPESGSFEIKDVDTADNLFTQENTCWEESFGNTSFNAYVEDIKVQIPDGGDAYVRVIHRWMDELSLVTEYEDDCGKVRMSRPASAKIESGDVYWFENVFAALDSPGEFYLEAETGILYYIPFEDENADTLTLYRPNTEFLLTVDGADSIKFEGISFCNTEWSLSVPADDGSLRAKSNIDSFQGSTDSTAAINISDAKGIEFVGCDFLNLGNCAIMFSSGSKDCKIENCRMKNIGSTAIAIWGENLPEGDENIISGISVNNNHIEAYGRHTYESVGVHLTYAESCNITHNEIHDGYYSGISCGWMWGHEYQVTKDIAIDDNLIYDIGQGWLGDIGGIYTLGEQPGTTLRGNVIVNVRCGTSKTSYGGNGIYTDAGSSYLLIENNLVYDCSANGINIGGNNKKNTVRNNIAAFCAQSQLNPGSGSTECVGIPCIATNNIFYSCCSPAILDINPGAFAESNNIMWDAQRGSRVFFNAGYNGDFERCDRLSKRVALANGFISNDIIADPLFVSAEARDFTLREESPASSVGFVAWDISNAGTQKGTQIGTERLPGGETSCSIIRDTSAFKVSGSKTYYKTLLIAFVLCLALAYAVSVIVFSFKVGKAPGSGKRAAAAWVIFAIAIVSGYFICINFINWNQTVYFIVSAVLCLNAGALQALFYVIRKPGGSTGRVILRAAIGAACFAAAFYAVIFFLDNIIDLKSSFSCLTTLAISAVYFSATVLRMCKHVSKES